VVMFHQVNKINLQVKEKERVKWFIIYLKLISAFELLSNSIESDKIFLKKLKSTGNLFNHQRRIKKLCI
jgi:hypothetical protein